MARFIEEDNKDQALIFPQRLDGYVAEDNPVRTLVASCSLSG